MCCGHLNVSMSKVTLLALNAKYVHSSLAVWYLAGAVAQFSRLKHEINVVEATINQPDSEILAQIIAAEPEILGVSTYIWNARKLEALLKEIKHCLPDTKLVLGGPESSYNAKHWLSQGADFVIQGEGERSFPLLLDALEENAALDMIPGLWRCYNGKFACTPEKEPGDTVIDPYTQAYFNALNGRIAYLETSRGCPFQCAFCLSGGSHLRFFPLDVSKKKLLKLSQSGTKTIKLVDRTFNCNTDRAYELLEYVIGLDTLCRFHFEVGADLFDERTLSLLRTAPAGRIQLEAGLQSFYEQTLNAVARQTSPEKAERNLRTILDGQNIHVHVDLIAGLPLESLVRFKQGFDRAYALGAHTLQLGFLKLLHGSALRIQAEQWGLQYSAAPPYEILSSPWLSTKDLDTIRQTEHALQRVYNSGRFITTVQYVLSVTGLSPFDLYHKIGAVMEGYGVQLDVYAEQLYRLLCVLPHVDADTLRNNMLCDWLCSTKGKNTPDFLRVPNGRVKRTVEYAERFLDRKIARCEAVVLWNGGGAFVDSNALDPVTGHYALHRVDLS